MKETFLNIKNQLFGKSSTSPETTHQDHNVPAPEYLELAPNSTDNSSKARVQQFIIQDFEDIKPVLDSLRAGSTIALVNIRPLKDRDIVELKRAVNKLKKTCDAIGGDLAGFGEDYVVATPEFAYIARGETPAPKPSSQEQYDDLTY
jgi:SepF-like predicted cell division protein (DUF552 family)